MSQEEKKTKIQTDPRKERRAELERRTESRSLSRQGTLLVRGEFKMGGIKKKKKKKKSNGDRRKKGRKTNTKGGGPF